MISTYLPNEKIEGKHLQDTVFVKRACTEMEAKIPTDDPWWNSLQTRDEWEVERRLEEIFKCEPDLDFQPAWIRDKTLQLWLNHANQIGDKSVVDFVGADIFSVQSVKYDFKDLQPKGGDEKVAAPKEKEEPKKKEKPKNGKRNKKD
jgi:hypothetical protein